jgi:hypothetical protein
MGIRCKSSIRASRIGALQSRRNGRLHERRARWKSDGYRWLSSILILVW